MQLDSTLIAGMIGAAIVLSGGVVAFFVEHGVTRATIAGLAARLTTLEGELGKIDTIMADVSYVRGILDGEARAARRAEPS
jgi:hypothetical protein